MCYHTESPKKKDLKEAVKIIDPQIVIFDYKEGFMNGFDLVALPVLLNSEAEKVQPINWGFVPPGEKFGYSTMNARCETVFDSKLYGEAIRKWRCLVFVQGFYEWKKPVFKAAKEPYYIKRNDNSVFVMGGIFKDWGKGFRNISIITTPANSLLTELRPEKPRMPLILDNDMFGYWLNEDTPEADLRAIMTTYNDGVLEGVKLPESPLKRKGNTNTLF